MRGYPAPCLLVFCVKGMHNLAGFLLPGKNCRQIMGKSAHRPFKKCSYVRAVCGSHMAQKNDAQKRNFDLWDASEHNSPKSTLLFTLKKLYYLLTFGYFSVHFINFEWFDIGGRIGQTRSFLFE